MRICGFAYEGNLPRINRTYKMARGRMYKDPAIVKIVDDIRWLTKAAMKGKEPFKVPVHVIIELIGHERADIDAPIKTVLDAMGPMRKRGKVIDAGIVYDDDKRVKRLTVYKFPLETGGVGMMVVDVETL